MGKILEARKEPQQILHLGSGVQAVESQGRGSQRGEWHIWREKGIGHGGYQPGWQPQVTKAGLGKGAGGDVYCIHFLRKGVGLGL